MKMSMFLILGVFTLTACTQDRDLKEQAPGAKSPNQTAPPAVAVQKSNEKPKQMDEDSYTPEERGRVSFVKLLQAVYENEGRRILVEAQGEDHDALVLSSGLIFDGSHTLDAARRETIDCPDCMLMLKKLRFRQLIIRGEKYQESYRVR